MVVLVHILSSMIEAYASNQSPNLSFAVNMGHVGGKGR